MNKVEKWLLDYGYEPVLIGFDYTVYAVDLMRRDIKYKKEIIKCLYPTIAEKFKTTPTRVERAIRHFRQKRTKMNNGNFIAYIELNTR